MLSNYRKKNCYFYFIWTYVMLICFMGITMPVVTTDINNYSSVTDGNPPKDFKDVIFFGPSSGNATELVTETTPSKGSNHLGDRCSELFSCFQDNAICLYGRCSCPPGYYEHRESQKKFSVCRQKRKFNESCFFHRDCQAHDSKSICSSFRSGHGRCECTWSTQHLTSQSSEGKCYKQNQNEGSTCQINEECRFQEGFKCMCAPMCRCTFLETDNPVKIQNILIGVFAVMAILIGAHLITWLFRRRLKNIWLHMHPQPTELDVDSEWVEIGTRFSQATAPSLQESPTVTVPFSLPPFPFPLSSHVPQVFPSRNQFATNVSVEPDLPPSYNDIFDTNKTALSIPPPSFHEIKLKEPLGK